MPKNKHCRAFTLIEIIIVLTIFMAMTVVVTVSVNKFSSQIGLTNLSYDIAASIRQAQVFGASVSQRSVGSCIGYQSGYGIVFYRADNNTYALFADDPKDCTPNPTDASIEYNRRCGAIGNDYSAVAECKSGSDKEYIKSYFIPRGNYIKRFCAVRQTGEEDCSDSSVPITYLAVSFVRPNPDAHFRTSCNVASTCPNAPVALASPSYDVPADNVYKEAYVVLQSSGSNRTNIVRIYETGYISSKGQ